MESSKIICGILWTFYLFVTLLNPSATGQTVLPYRRVLDPKTFYILEWRVHREENTILFKIAAQVPSSVSVVFGLTNKRQLLEGADVVIFGINQSGRAYIHDMNGVSNSTLKSDVQQNWEVVSAQRFSSGRIQVSISRKLHTCDDDGDIVITPNLINVIWGYVETGKLTQRGNNRIDSVRFTLDHDTLPVYLLDKELPPLSSSIQTWRFSVQFRMPPGRQTSYRCSIHRAPRLQRKNHIVGFSAYFKDSVSRSHVHHQNVFRCIAPPGVDPTSVFEPFVNQPGQECYFNEDNINPQLPVPFCREIVYLWAVGGYDAQLPENVGFPLGEEPVEYFMLETHYDNFDMLPNLVVENGVDFRHTRNLRENDGGMSFIGYGVANNIRTESIFAVPPHSTDFTIAGQCSPACVRKMLPPSGLEIVAVTLHGHIATRKMRLKHYRNNQELPMIQTDENYDFNFQQMRLLTTPVTIMPGDHLIAECVYDNSWKNGSTVSGLATKDEMCNAFIYTNKRIPFMHCGSEYPSSKVLSRFGVRNMTWDLDLYERVVTSSSISPSHVGLPFSQVVNLLSYNWTPKQRSNFQMEMQYSRHVATCLSLSEIAQRIQPDATGATSSADESLPSVVYPRTATPANFPTLTQTCYQ